ncbi:MAG TPA: SDR family oxidoreductase [Polyangiaceae bacterium]|nr:SDR family oxidoreductase [Polyangiaceae bacterium]
MAAVELRGRSALVTGAAKRVGRAIAVALGGAGMRVAVHYKDSANDAAETCRRVAAAGGRAVALSADLRDRAAARKLVDDAEGALGGLDLLVGNAAGYERRAFSDVDDAAWDRMVELNLSAQFALASRAAPCLARAKGSIVFVTCASATAPYANHLPYVVAKGGLRQLMRTLALELAPDVRVNAVAPGMVLSPDGFDAALAERIGKRIPLGPIGSPEDVADAVLFLARSPFITGHEILVDGGRNLT